MMKVVYNIFFKILLVCFITTAVFAAEVDSAVLTSASTSVDAATDESLLLQQPSPKNEIQTEVKKSTQKDEHVNNLKENEILLNIDNSKKASDSSSTSTRLFLTFCILSGILGVTYLLVRKYKLSNNINKSNKQIKIISQHYLGPKKSLAIIHVAGESMLIGVTDSNISMIKSLSLIDDEVPAELPQKFSDSLDLKTNPVGATLIDVATQQTKTKVQMADELEEEFSFSGIKDTVSKKLRSMRSI